MNYKIPRGCSVLGEVTQVVIVWGSFPPCAGVHKPPLPLHRSSFTRASAMVGTGSASWYTQLTVWAIKLGPQGAWQRVSSLLGHLQPGQVPEVMGWGVFWLKPLWTLLVRVFEPCILILKLSSISSAGLSPERRTGPIIGTGEALPQHNAFTYLYLISLVQKTPKSWENDLNIKESDKGGPQLHHFHHCKSATKCLQSKCSVN